MQLIPLVYTILRVAIIDTGYYNPIKLQSYLCDNNSLINFTPMPWTYNHKHGTAVTTLVLEDLKPDPRFCIVLIKFYNNSSEFSDKMSLKAYKIAIKKQVNIINFSSCGDDPFLEEKQLIYDNPQITFIVPSGNDHRSLQDIPSYPCSYPFPNIVCIGALGNFGNRGKEVNMYLNGDYEDMRGTSFAVPRYTNLLIKRYLSSHGGLR